MTSTISAGTEHPAGKEHPAGTEHPEGIEDPFICGLRLTPNLECPVVGEALQVAILSEDLAKSLRRLRRSLRACQECPLGPECRAMTGYNERVTAAIAELTEEWGLAA